MVYASYQGSLDNIFRSHAGGDGISRRKRTAIFAASGDARASKTVPRTSARTFDQSAFLRISETSASMPTTSWPPLKAVTAVAAACDDRVGVFSSVSTAFVTCGATDPEATRTGMVSRAR